MYPYAIIVILSSVPKYILLNTHLSCCFIYLDYLTWVIFLRLFLFRDIEVSKFSFILSKMSYLCEQSSLHHDIPCSFCLVLVV